MLLNETAALRKARNEKAVKVNWQFTTEDARMKLKKLYPILKSIVQKTY